MRKNRENVESWQWRLLAGLLLMGIAVVCDGVDAAANFAFGQTFGGFAPYLLALGAVAWSLTLAIFGHFGWSWRCARDWFLAALFAIGLAVTLFGALASHGARMGAQINATVGAEKEVQRAEAAVNVALRAEKEAQEAREAADRAVEAYGETGLPEALEARIAEIQKDAKGIASARAKRGVEGDTFEELCPQIRDCREEMKKAAPLKATLPKAKARAEAAAAASSRAQDLAARRMERQEAQERLTLASRTRPQSSLTDAASLGGGDASESARWYALWGGRLLVALTLIGACASFPGASYIGSALELRSAQTAAQKPKAGARTKPTGGGQRAPKTEPAHAEKEPNVLKFDPERKAQKQNHRASERALAAHLLAQTSPKLSKAQIGAELKKRFGTTRSTAQRIMKEVQEAQTGKAQNREAQAQG